MAENQRDVDGRKRLAEKIEHQRREIEELDGGMVNLMRVQEELTGQIKHARAVFEAFRVTLHNWRIEGEDEDN